MGTPTGVGTLSSTVDLPRVTHYKPTSLLTHLLTYTYSSEVFVISANTILRPPLHRDSWESSNTKGGKNVLSPVRPFGPSADVRRPSTTKGEAVRTDGPNAFGSLELVVTVDEPVSSAAHLGPPLRHVVQPPRHGKGTVTWVEGEVVLGRTGQVVRSLRQRVPVHGVGFVRRSPRESRRLERPLRPGRNQKMSKIAELKSYTTIPSQTGRPRPAVVPSLEPGKEIDSSTGCL